MIKKALSLSLFLLVLTAGQLAAAGSGAHKKSGEVYEVYNQGVDLMVAGDYAAAQERFEKALTLKKDFAEAHNNLGYSLRKQGADHYAAALEHYNHALELNPQLAEALMYRGVLFTLMGDEEEAKADHATLVELSPELAEQLLQVIATGEEPEGTAGLAARWKE